MNTTNDFATGTMKTAVQRLLYRYPLFAGIVAGWHLEAGGTDTIAIGMTADGFVLHFNPEFVSSLQMEELVGILHHEARHVVYGHVLLDTADYPDEHALTVAAEVTCNEDLPEPLPEGAVLLRDFPQLPPDEDTETRYDRLRKRKDDEQSAKKSQRRKQERGSASPNSSSTSKRKGRNISAPLDSSGSRSQHEHSNAAPSKSSKADELARPVDDHDRWEEIRDQESLARSLIDVALQEAVSDPHSLPDDVREQIEQISQAWGLDPGRVFAELERRENPAKVNWREQLRRYVGRELEQAPSYARPPRRFPNLLGIVPGTVRRSAKPRITAVLDTSASITDEMLADISSELRKMARNREVTVVECDAEIHSVYRYSKPITEVAGRGGTDLRPALERAFLRKTRADLVVYFTDGEGPAPDKEPQVPVVWCLTPGGHPPATWGKVVQMG